MPGTLLYFAAVLIRVVVGPLALIRHTTRFRVRLDRGHAAGAGVHAVIDASNAAHLPALALNLVEPAGRLVYIGLVAFPA